MNVVDVIKKRRSIRRFRKERISSAVIKRAIEAGRWAPSGLNNQPWRFKVLGGQKKKEISIFTKYYRIVNSADKIILVFLDKDSSYHREKDCMAIGACIQNILLYLHSQRLGACWLGEILNKKKEINRQLSVTANLELMAAIAVGRPASLPKKTARKSLKGLIVEDEM